MTENNRVWQRLLIYPVACMAGFGIAWFDVAAPFGDDTEKGTILLWLLSSGIFGLVWPVRPWRWAMLIGLPVPAVHFALHWLNAADSLNPNAYSTIMILLPVSAAVCLFAAYSGSFLRHASQL